MAKLDVKIKKFISAAKISRKVAVALDRDLKNISLLTETAIKNRTPAPTGRLKASMTAREVKFLDFEVATAVKYACVFGAHTAITTNKGYSTIGQIKIGDKVLTQDGNFHKVLATNSFPAMEKPCLVNIETEFRKKRTHKLTLTTDHKVLVFRGCRHKWVEAGKLLKTDCLMTRIKIPHNKGKAKKHQCICCGIIHTRQGKKFCSMECRTKYWKDGHNPSLGTKRTIEARNKMSKIIRQRLIDKPETHPSRIVSQQGFSTSHKKQTEEWLIGLGVKYEKQKSIGRYFVDFYIPEWNTIIECDGAYWHKDQNKDIKRDKDIIKILPKIHIIHIHFYNKRHSPNLITKPLKNTEYVAVNPNINSYVDLSQFKPCKILSVKKWKYKGNQAKLYDLTVEGMHSFYANGIIVSNSYVEFGTSRMAPRAMMRKGAEDIRKKGLSLLKHSNKVKL